MTAERFREIMNETSSPCIWTDTTVQSFPTRVGSRSSSPTSMDPSLPLPQSSPSLPLPFSRNVRRRITLDGERDVEEEVVLPITAGETAETEPQLDSEGESEEEEDGEAQIEGVQPRLRVRRRVVPLDHNHNPDSDDPSFLGDDDPFQPPEGSDGTP